MDFGGLDTLVPSYGDKIFHFCAYALLTWLWYRTFIIKLKCSKTKAIITVAILCTTFGIIIEVLQKVLTYTRFFDIEDIVANVLGVVIISMLLMIYKKSDVKI